MKRIILAAMVSACVTGCAKKNMETTDNNAPVEIQPEHVGVGVGWMDSKPRNNGIVNALPKKTAFKMSGDYADNVAITLAPDGQIIYFPDPSDITPESKPVSLGDGWWLNRQGISANSVFTRYTFDEYAKLKEVPTIKQLKAAIIPGACVTEMKVLADR